MDFPSVGSLLFESNEGDSKKRRALDSLHEFSSNVLRVVMETKKAFYEILKDDHQRGLRRKIQKARRAQKLQDSLLLDERSETVVLLEINNVPLEARISSVPAVAHVSEKTIIKIVPPRGNEIRINNHPNAHLKSVRILPSNGDFAWVVDGAYLPYKNSNQGESAPDVDVSRLQEILDQAFLHTFSFVRKDTILG